MAQPFYPADDEVSFESHPKRDALLIPHTIQRDNKPELVDRNLSCINTAAEIEAKGRGGTRRRIPLACQRCRRRKIKCSGDAGDGQGCSNCRSTGNPCHFIRVNSSILQTKTQASTGPGWPYPANDMASQRPGTYTPSVSSSKMGGLPETLPNHRIPPFSRTSDYEVAPDTPTPYGRPPFGIESTVSYDDDSSTPYHIQQSSTYMLPSSPQVFMPDYYGLEWDSKGWGTALPGSRAPAETMFSESDAGSPLAHPAYPYMISGQGTQSNAALSVVPIQGSLTSLTQGTERTLPNPTGRTPFSGNTSGAATTMDGPPAAYYKPGHRWASRCEHSAPMPPMPDMPFNDPTMDRAKPNPSTSGQDMAFSFLPVASSSVSSPPLASSGTTSGLESASCSAEVGDEFRGSADSRHRTFSRDSRRTVPVADYRSSSYGYTRPAYRNRPEADESISEGTLINGMAYTRPTYPANLSQVDEKPRLQAIARHSSYTSLCSQ
ncbi:hypothetical protein BJX76DRAFT_347756 [Aspergillus varians]